MEDSCWHKRQVKQWSEGKNSDPEATRAPRYSLDSHWTSYKVLGYKSQANFIEVSKLSLTSPDIWVLYCLLDVSFALITLLFYACLPCQTERYTVLGTFLSSSCILGPSQAGT